MEAKIRQEIAAGRYHTPGASEEDIRKWAEKSVKHRLEQEEK